MKWSVATVASPVVCLVLDDVLAKNCTAVLCCAVLCCAVLCCAVLCRFLGFCCNLMQSNHFYILILDSILLLLFLRMPKKLSPTSPIFVVTVPFNSMSTPGLTFIVTIKLQYTKLDRLTKISARVLVLLVKFQC